MFQIKDAVSSADYPSLCGEVVSLHRLAVFRTGGIYDPDIDTVVEVLWDNGASTIHKYPFSDLVLISKSSLKCLNLIPYDPCNWTVTINGEKPYGFTDQKLVISRYQAGFCLHFTSPWTKRLIDEIHNSPSKELHLYVSYRREENQEPEVYVDYRGHFDDLEYSMEAGREVPEVKFWVSA